MKKFILPAALALGFLSVVCLLAILYTTRPRYEFRTMFDNVVLVRFERATGRAWYSVPNHQDWTPIPEAPVPDFATLRPVAQTAPRPVRSMSFQEFTRPASNEISFEEAMKPPPQPTNALAR